MAVTSKAKTGELVLQDGGGTLDIDSPAGRARWGGIVDKMKALAKDVRAIKKGAYEIGCDLLDLKRDCVRGQFTEQLMSTTEVARATCYRYMQFAERLRELPDKQRAQLLNSDEGIIAVVAALKRLASPDTGGPGEANESEWAEQYARWKAIDTVRGAAGGLMTKVDVLAETYGESQECITARKAAKTALNALQKWSGPKPAEPEE